MVGYVMAGFNNGWLGWNLRSLVALASKHFVFFCPRFARPLVLDRLFLNSELAFARPLFAFVRFFVLFVDSLDCDPASLARWFWMGFLDRWLASLDFTLWLHWLRCVGL